VDWAHLTQDRERYQASVNTLMNIWSPERQITELLVEWLALLFRIREVLVSNFGLQPAILTRVFRNFTQFLQTNSGLDLNICHCRFLAQPF
jgi:hypothetical protein